ncbi:MAG: uncharacterized protein JWP97_5135 [Labilithrix sp.]|nr:uncharacterized protein [Labilithrix sp.]
MKLQGIVLVGMAIMGVVACSGGPDEEQEAARPARSTQRLGTTPTGDVGLLCAHPICAVGAPLGTVCDVCTTLLCGKDPYCCSTAWDATCVGEVSAICGQSCTAPVDAGTEAGTTCAHAVCATGPALETTCDPCATSLCAQDPYCCSTSWDATCVGEVASICGKTCL